MHRVTARLRSHGNPTFAFGGDYNPEQWPESVWAEDVELMKQAGVNLVSVGIFSWALLEPKEGRYEFGWLDRILDLLHGSGISVDLANATASPPPWFSAKYPESLPVTADGVRHSYGSRQAFCASSADYRRAAAALTRAIVGRYGDHPAVVMWHVHNEYGCHNQPCYCDVSAAAFRGWLQRKYSTLDQLNDAWGTAFWSQHYYDWEEILPPRTSGTWVNPTQQLDFARFSSDELLDCFKAEAQILRASTPYPVTTNFMGFMMGLHRPVDYWRWVQHMDLVSNDHYLIAEDPRNFQELAMTADLTRGWADGAPWLLMEHSTSAVNWQPRNIAKRPGELLRNSLQHVARGADGVLFFQWRAAKAGAEKYHSALLPHGGTDTKVWREVLELGRVLRAIGEVAGSRVADVEVALLHDTDARWAGELDSHPSVDVSTMTETRAWHDALYRAGISTDFRQSSDNLSHYRLVIVPVQYLISDESAANLRGYVEGGGRLLVTYFSGIVDVNDHIRQGGHPGAFADLLGIRTEEFFPLRAGESIALSDFGAGTVWSELGRATTAELLAEYTDGAVAGSAAVTRHAVGRGAAYYVGTALSTQGRRALLDRIVADAGVRPVVPRIGPAVAGGPADSDAADRSAAVEDVEVVERVGAAGRWLFVINHGEHPATVPASGTELITGAEVRDTLTIAAGAVSVVRRL